VSLIANKEDLEGWKGYMDICTTGCNDCARGDGSPCNRRGCGKKCITLPREVDTVIGVNIGGHPALGYGQLFSFHLNGPGDCKTTCEWRWQDAGNFHCTYKDVTEPGKIVARLQSPADNNKEVVIFGFDDQGQVLRRQDSDGNWINGYQVPTIYGLSVPDDVAPVVSRITGIYKQETVGSIGLSTTDSSGATGTLFTVMEPDETLPQYRRISLNRACNWARIAYRKINPTFTSKYDHIPLRSRQALLMAVRAVKNYSDLMRAEGNGFEADAARMELEAQQMAEPPTYFPVQVIDLSNPRDKTDYDIR
jgi:hypothetical protein